jgi:4-hydroxybenzoate polyprenyltransferase
MVDSIKSVHVKFLSLIRLLRPKQWVKNLFVLAPLLFSGEFKSQTSLLHALLAFGIFCVASSSAYIVNDIKDIERDRAHPQKSKRRPLASGDVSISEAIALLVILYLILLYAWFAFYYVVELAVVYLLINIAYTFYLKNQPILDIFSIAIGFTLRVYAGTIALGIPASSWMEITTLCLALYLAAIKRRQELIQNGTDGRKVLEQYTVSLMDRYAEISATGALLFYSMYVMTAKPELVVTIPLVLFGMFRYWFVVDALDGGESPTDALLADGQLVLTLILWVVLCAWVLFPT